MSNTDLFTVSALWDDEAGVWVAESVDVPGLVTKAPTFERLVAKLKIMIPELLELNGGPRTREEIVFRVRAERIARVMQPAA